MGRSAPLTRTCLALVVLSVFPGTVRGQSGTDAEWRERDEWQRVPAVVAALGVSRGSRVADIGAGDGYFTAHLSKAVGSAGKVYSVDVSERSMTALRDLVRTRSLPSVEIIRGKEDDPRLPRSSLDAALIVNAYHDMDEHQAMLAGILKSLKPGGRLVVLDFGLHEAPEDASRKQQTAEHELDVGLAERELQRAGFEILERAPEFTRLGSNRQYTQWMLVARRPAASDGTGRE